MREPIVLACEALRSDRPINMGQCVELFEIAQDEDEVRAITDAYAECLSRAGHGSRAEEVARSNILTGLSYMSRDEAHDLYRAVFAKEER